MDLEFNCPRCNAIQKFGEQKRDLENGKIEVFIRCSKCRWKFVLITGDSSYILNEREIAKLKRKVLRENSLYPVLKRKLKRRNDFKR